MKPKCPSKVRVKSHSFVLSLAAGKDKGFPCMHTSLWHVVTGAHQLLANFYTTFGLQLLTHSSLHMRTHVQCKETYCSTEWPHKRQKLHACFEGRASSAGDQFSSRKCSSASVRDTCSPLGAKSSTRSLTSPVWEGCMPTTTHLGKEAYITPQQVILKTHFLKRKM